MSRKLRFLLILIPSVLVILALAVYILLAEYYKNVFSYGTWINGVYCTGKGTEEINNELKTKYLSETIKFIYNEEEKLISAAEIDFNADFSNELKDIAADQNPYLWFVNLFKADEKIEIDPIYSYSENKLLNVVSSLSIVTDNPIHDTYTVKIKSGDSGYELVDTKKSYVDTDKICKAIILAFISDSDVEADDSFFCSPDYTEKENEIIKDWNDTQEYFRTKLYIDMGDEPVPIDKAVLSRFISVGTAGKFLKLDGKLIIDKEAVDAYVDELLDKYDTYKATRDFITTDGETKTIDLVMYGTLTDHQAMKDYLYDAIVNNAEETYTPEYIREAYTRGLNDIGGTYVEVDMGKQVLYYYRDYELVLTTDVVTGKPSTLTPAMITCVSSKSKNVTLKGTNYSSFVNYWIPIYPKMGIGLHDASWQSTFGGDVYLTRGSHGCINMIKEDISFLYDELEVGVPVICYY